VNLQAVSLRSLSPIVVAAMIAPGMAANAGSLEGISTATWQDASAPRPVPFLMNFNDHGECTFVRSETPDNPKGTFGCPRQIWLTFLASKGLDELQAPSGGRAYRWIWMDGWGAGFVQLTVRASGTGELRSSKDSVTVPVDAGEVSTFEDSLGKTDFATQVLDDGSSGLDEWQDDLFEAVIDGRYHFVRRAGVSSWGFQYGARILIKLAGFEPPKPDPNCKPSGVLMFGRELCTPLRRN
jgi:hypothetical protein